jgi:hypothetical protein
LIVYAAVYARPSLSSFDFRANQLISLEPGVGFEPTTCGLQNRCSTAELTRHIKDLASEPAFCHRIAIARK